jgi:hypothetical protein
MASFKSVALLLARHIVLMILLISSAIIISISQIATKELWLLFTFGVALLVSAVLYFRFVRDWSRWFALASGLAVVWFLVQMVLRVWF